MAPKPKHPLSEKCREVTSHLGTLRPEEWQPPSPDVPSLATPTPTALPSATKCSQSQKGRTTAGAGGSGSASEPRGDKCAESPICTTFSQGPCGAARHAGICWGCGPGGQLGIKFQGQSLLLEAVQPPAVHLVQCHQGRDPGSVSGGKEGRMENDMSQPPDPLPQTSVCMSPAKQVAGSLGRPFLHPRGPLPASGCLSTVWTSGITPSAHIRTPWLCRVTVHLHCIPTLSPVGPHALPPAQRPSPDTGTRETRQGANGLRAAKGSLGPCFLAGCQFPYAEEWEFCSQGAKVWVGVEL